MGNVNIFEHQRGKPKGEQQFSFNEAEPKERCNQPLSSFSCISFLGK